MYQIFVQTNDRRNKKGTNVWKEFKKKVAIMQYYFLDTRNIFLLSHSFFIISGDPKFSATTFVC